MAKVDNVYIKIPSSRGIEAHKREYAGIISPNQIRPAEGLECPEQLDQALQEYPEFKTPLKEFSSYDVNIVEEARHHRHR